MSNLDSSPSRQDDKEARADLSIQSDDVVVDAAAESVDVEGLDPELVSFIQREARLQAVAVVSHESHSGPMPSPRQLAMYDSVLPGTAKIIRDEFQTNSAHVREMERRALDAHKDDNDKNRKAAEKLIWGAIGLILVLALLGREHVAIAVAVSLVGAVVTGFLSNRYRSTKREAEQDDHSSSE